MKRLFRSILIVPVLTALVFVASTSKAQNAYSILKEAGDPNPNQETNPFYGDYKRQAFEIMYHYKIDDPKSIPCSKIDKIDIYGNGDGVINPHYAVPAASHNEWDKMRAHFSAAYSDTNDACNKIAVNDRIFFNGTCHAVGDVYDVDKNKHYTLKKDVAAKMNPKVFCQPYATSAVINRGARDDSGRKYLHFFVNEPAQGDALYPDAIMYHDKNGEPIKYARECHSDKIDSSSINFRFNTDANADGFNCESVSGTKEIAPNDVNAAFGKYLVTESFHAPNPKGEIKYFHYTPADKNPFYSASAFDSGAGGTPQNNGANSTGGDGSRR